MGRCGCGNACSCVIQGDGSTTSVIGTGSEANPYIVSATGTDTDVTVLDTGSIDLTITGTGAPATPFVISGVVLPSADADNCFELGTDGGAYVACPVEVAGAGVVEYDGKGQVAARPVAPNSMDDEFNDATGHSGPVNGLDAKWSKHNLGTASWLVLDDTKAPGCLLFDLPAVPQDQAIYQPVPVGDFRVSAQASLVYQGSRQMWGLLIVDSSGNGIGVFMDDGDATTYLRTVTAWVVGANLQTVSSLHNADWTGGHPVVLSLRKDGSNYWGGVSFSSGRVMPLAFKEAMATPTAFTPAYVGFGRAYTPASLEGRVLLDWFRVGNWSPSIPSGGSTGSLQPGDGIDIAGTGTFADPFVIVAEKIEEINTVAAAGATETLPDVTTATVHHLTLDANLTLTFPTPVAGKSFTLILKQDATGSRTVTWPGAVVWPGATAPTLTTTANKSDAFSFLCADGTNWLGFTAGQNF